jgi:hypothetical protein
MRGLVASLFGLFIIATLCTGQFTQFLKKIITTDNVISSGNNMVHYSHMYIRISFHTYISINICI